MFFFAFRVRSSSILLTFFSIVFFGILMASILAAILIQIVYIFGWGSGSRLLLASKLLFIALSNGNNFLTSRNITV